MFYFLLALTVVLAAATANAATPVFDTDGDVLTNASSYFILPANSGICGGLTVRLDDEKCPFKFILDNSESNDGYPVLFSNWKSKRNFVPESENLNIELNVAPTSCGESSYWWVEDWYVRSGTKPNGYGEDSLKSFFKIKKVRDGAYKFVSCPSDCEEGSKGCPGCKNIGIYHQYSQIRRLAIMEKPFLFKFKKDNLTPSLSKAMPM